MRRFQRIDTDDSLMKSIVDKLIEMGYKKVPDWNGGDDDFLVIDSVRKEYIWCEFGVSPFCSDDNLRECEYHHDQDSISLEIMLNDRC